DVLLLPAIDPAVGLHVSISRHAGLGAVHRAGAAAHPFSAHRPRRAAQGQRLERDRPGGLADRAVHAGRDRDRAALLPQYAGLAIPKSLAREQNNGVRRGASMKLALNVNGKPASIVTDDAEMPLLYALRDD